MKKLIFSALLSILIIPVTQASLVKDLIEFHQIFDNERVLFKRYTDANALKNSFVQQYFQEFAILADFACRYVKENPTSLDIFDELEGRDTMERRAAQLCGQAENLGFSIGFQDAKTLSCLQLSLQAAMFIYFSSWDDENDVFFEIEDEEIFNTQDKESLMRAYGAQFAVNIQKYTLKQLTLK